MVENLKKNWNYLSMCDVCESVLQYITVENWINKIGFKYILTLSDPHFKRE